MRTLIVGVGALGGIVGARMLAAGCDVSLATRDRSAAEQISAKGLKVTGIGGEIEVGASDVRALDSYTTPGEFDLIVLATKAFDATVAAPALIALLASGGVLLPIQNGGVPAMLAEQLGVEHVLGGLSNLGATMLDTGLFEQRNAGYLLIGELLGGSSERAAGVRDWLGQAVDVRVTENLRGSIWAKLLLNCSVTTIGALAGCPMADYIKRPEGLELFEKTYDETVRVALDSNNAPERMIVDPIPPPRGADGNAPDYRRWLDEILKNYGSLKPSMLQDIDRNRPTEIDFINGYVADVGRAHGVGVAINSAIVEAIRDISRKGNRPDIANLGAVLMKSGAR